MPFAEPTPPPAPGNPARGQPIALGLIVWLCLLWAGSGLAQGWLEEGRLEVQKARMPVYLAFEPKPAALFTAERLYEDHQTKGFFKIGLLPLVVLDQLSLELRDPARLAATLQSAGGRFAVKEELKKAVEGRDFSLFFAAENSGRLTARRVRLENGAAWRLSEGVLTPPASAPIPFKRGTLHLTGPQAGEFVGETTDGPVHVQLLSLLPKKAT
jgi:hypothetical protein